MAKEVDTIETDRLILRGINNTDAESIVLWRSNPEVYKYFKSPHRITLEEHLNWYQDRYLENSNRFDWICLNKSTENRLGVFGLIKEKDKAEINYLVSPEGQHKGYALEVIRKLIDYAIKKWNSKQVIAEVHKDNIPSLGLVKKLGFDVVSEDDPFLIYGIEV